MMMVHSLLLCNTAIPLFQRNPTQIFDNTTFLFSIRYDAGDKDTRVANMAVRLVWFEFPPLRKDTLDSEGCIQLA